MRVWFSLRSHWLWSDSNAGTLRPRADNIEANIVSASQFVETGTSELNRANDYQVWFGRTCTFSCCTSERAFLSGCVFAHFPDLAFLSRDERELRINRHALSAFLRAVPSAKRDR